MISKRNTSISGHELRWAPTHPQPENTCENAHQDLRFGIAIRVGVQNYTNITGVIVYSLRLCTL
jgi:hypothetical protein